MKPINFEFVHLSDFSKFPEEKNCSVYLSPGCTRYPDDFLSRYFRIQMKPAEAVLGGKRTLGILARGTDYTIMNMGDSKIHATVFVLSKCDGLMASGECNGLDVAKSFNHGKYTRRRSERRRTDMSGI